RRRTVIRGVRHATAMSCRKYAAGILASDAGARRRCDRGCSRPADDFGDPLIADPASRRVGRTSPAPVGGEFGTVLSRWNVAKSPLGWRRSRRTAGLPALRAAGAVWSGLPPAPEHGLAFFLVDAGLKRRYQGLDGERFKPFDHGDCRLSRLGGFAEFGPHVVAEDVGEFTGNRPAVLLDDATRPQGCFGA